MRIVLFIHGFQKFGGLEEIVAKLAVYLRQQGHQTSVVCSVWVAPDNQYKRHMEENGVPLIQWPFMSLVRPLAWMRVGLPTLLRTRSGREAAEAIRRWEQTVCESTGWWYITSRGHEFWTRRLLAFWCWIFRPDLMHLHSYVYEINETHILEWSHARGLPTLFEEHQTPDPSLDQWNDFRRRINLATTVGAVSERAAEIMRDDLGVLRPIKVLPIIVADPMRPEHGEPKAATGVEGLNITAVARLIPSKGLPYLFEAIAQIREIHPTIRFRLYGDGPSPTARAARESAVRFGLDLDKTFAGTFRRHELPDVLLAADIFVQPSLSEGLPLAVVEAMAGSRAIVATTVGGIPQLLEDGVTGLLCPPGDAQSLVRAICRLIESPEERTRLGRAARQAYERGPFRLDPAVGEHVTLYQETLRLAREAR
jgi:glycosyltransferase involved in cell wall biosynthesis